MPAAAPSPIRVTRPAWLAAELRGAIEPGRLDFRFPQPVRAVLRKARKVAPSVWAERHRVVHKSALPGPWRNDVTPYLAGIMDGSMWPSVRKTVICKAPQTGVTEAVINCVCALIDQDPADTIFLYPNREMGRENIEERIIPAIRSAPRLARYMTGMDDDLSKSRIRLLPMTIYIAWAHSPASMANRPAKYIVIEEPDKNPEVSSKREASPERLIEARTTTWPDDHKIWMFSSPSIEAAPIWQALTTECQVIFEYHVVCPSCGHVQVMEFGRIRTEEGERDPERIEQERLAWYECAACAAHWDDTGRNRAVAAGGWRARGRAGAEDARPLPVYLREENPGKIGFHLPSWLSRFVPLARPLASFMRGQTSKAELKDWCNKHAAEPWLSYEKARQEDAILALRDDRPRGVVPGGGQAAALVAFVDTQDVGFWYTVWAIGYGLTGAMWLVREGFVLAWEDLERILWEDEYRDVDGARYPVQQTLIDSGGHRTMEVYTWCVRHRTRTVFPAKGERTMAQPYAYSKLEYYPGLERRIPGGLMLIRINTTLYKDEFNHRLAIAPGDPGGVRLHAETGEEFARQLCAEAVDEHGLWQQIGSRDNHYWDCGFGALVAADIRGVKYWPQPGAAKAAPVERKKEQSVKERW